MFVPVSLIGELPCSNKLHRKLAISPDGKFLASGDAGGEVRLWDLRDLSKPEEIPVHQCMSQVGSVSFSSDSRFLVAAGDDGLKSWSVDSGREIELIKGDTHSINRAAFSPRGGLLAAHYQDVKLSVWDTNDAREVAKFDSVPETTCLSFSADGRFIAAGSDNGSITLFDVRREKTIRLLQGHMRWRYCRGLHT